MNTQQAHNLLEAIIKLNDASFALRKIKDMKLSKETVKATRLNINPVRTKREQVYIKKAIDALLDDFVQYGVAYDRLDVAKSESTEDLSNYYYEFIKEVSKVKIYKTEEARRLLEAHSKDPRSINGIVNKVL